MNQKSLFLRKKSFKIVHSLIFRFLVMDATKLQFDNDHFSVIIDKGTLDALMTNQEPETVQRVLKYFEEVKRVLKQGGNHSY